MGEYLRQHPRVLSGIVLAIIGLLLRTVRNRRSRGRQTAGQTAAILDSSTAPATEMAPPGEGRSWFLRKVRPIPARRPPRIHLAPGSVAWFDHGSPTPTWVAKPDQVEIEYKPPTTFGVNMPTAVIRGPGGEKQRGRLTDDPRAPLGAFDMELEEKMAHELIDFLAYARRCKVRVTSKRHIPTPYEADGVSLTRLVGPQQ